MGVRWEWGRWVGLADFATNLCYLINVLYCLEMRFLAAYCVYISAYSFWGFHNQAQ